jgi:hypothetical protein
MQGPHYIFVFIRFVGVSQLAIKNVEITDRNAPFHDEGISIESIRGLGFLFC